MTTTKPKLTDALARTLYELVRYYGNSTGWFQRSDLFTRRDNTDNAHRRNLSRLIRLGLVQRQTWNDLGEMVRLDPSAKAAWDAWYNAGGWRKLSGGVWHE